MKKNGLKKYCVELICIIKINVKKLLKMCIKKLLRIKKKTPIVMDKDTLINNKIEEFISNFREHIDNDNIDAHEMTDEVIKSILLEFFATRKLTEAERLFNNATNKYVEDTYNKIDWKLDREARRETPEFKQWYRYNHISSAMYSCYRNADLRKFWVSLNGKTHTDEEAATIAADKWCELLFKWHLQDNGALNEEHGGGFQACALGTALANDAKENITYEMKIKAHELFKEYYKRFIHYSNTNDAADVKWLKDTLPDAEKEFDWKYGFSYEMYCDYDPSYPLYLILYHAGIQDYTIRVICPWKTGISIRPEDNTVMYKTYQNIEEI